MILVIIVIGEGHTSALQQMCNMHHVQREMKRLDIEGRRSNSGVDGRFRRNTHVVPGPLCLMASVCCFVAIS